MDEGTRSPYATLKVWERRATGGRITELADLLRDREDHGDGFWTMQAVESLPDSPPIPARFWRPPLPPQADGPVVYYLRFGDRVKIGTSVNLKGRLADIPYDEVLATEAGSYEVESERHRQFAHLRVRGEWFRAEPDLLEFVATLA